MMGRIFLITGGARSGKSTFAESLCIDICNEDSSRCYIATAQVLDDEMKERVDKHRQCRGESFVTVEEPLELGRAIREAGAVYKVILVDCLTLWTSNLVLYLDEKGQREKIEDFISALKECRSTVVLVTNETGMGIVPDNSLSRCFRDLAGIINQRTASCADSVVLMVCGIPVYIKKPEVK